MMLDLENIEALRFRGIRPFNSQRWKEEFFPFSTFKNLEKVSRCWFTSGRVGARKITFPQGYFLSLLRATFRAIIVFPKAVGRMTKVLCSDARSEIACWYSLCSMVSSFPIETLRLFQDWLSMGDRITACWESCDSRYLVPN